MSPADAAIPIAAILLGFVASRGVGLVVWAITPIVLVAALWAAARHSGAFLVGSVLVLTLVPIVGVPMHGIVHPGVLGLMVLALASLIGLVPRGGMRITVIDVAVLAIAVGCLVSVAYGHQTVSNLGSVFFLWFSPFVVGKMLTASHSRITVLKAFAVAGAIAIPLGIIEVAFGNPFLQVFPFSTDVQHNLGISTQRFGMYRAEGSFGQPLPYAMFLSLAAVAAITLWMDRPVGRRNHWLYLGAGMVAIQAAAFARTGWLLFVVAAALVLVLGFNRIVHYGNRRLVTLSVIGLVIILSLPQTSALLSGGSNAEAAKLDRTANYRSLLVKQALTPGYIDPLGTTQEQIGPNGSRSIDNEYIHLAWQWGYIPVGGLGVLFVAFVAGAWRYRKDTVMLGVYAACVATMVALESVAFITQQQVLIWLLWGCASGLVQPSGVGADVGTTTKDFDRRESGSTAKAGRGDETF